MADTTTEDFRLDDGRNLRLTFAEPDGVTRGGLVVLHEARGITDGVLGMVVGLAAEGWLVVVPHLYSGDHGSAEVGAEQAADKVSELTGESVLAATDIAFAWLAGYQVTPDRIGVIGFELGGSVALVVAASRDIGAAVTVTGGGILRPVSDSLPALVDVAGDLRCPWLGLYREHDPAISEDEVTALRDAAAGASVAADVARFDSDTGLYDAWQRALNWFDAHLR